MKLNIVIPCAGSGQRFQEAGFNQIKPFILSKNKLMLDWVIDNLSSTEHDILYTFLFQQKHIELFDVEMNIINLFKPRLLVNRNNNIDYQIVPIQELTDGSATTILRCRNKIDLDLPLIVANSDQFISGNFDLDRWLGWASKDNASILTFHDNDRKWSFVEPIDYVYAKRVAEKEPISNIANVGIFYYKIGDECMWAINQMKEKNIRINNEFYLAPSMNELIEDNAKVSYKLIEPYQKMWGLGTPSDLKYFEENYK